MTKRISITATVTEGVITRSITVSGRDAWALQELVAAGGKGCTPIDNPGPRWSAYVHKLRHRYGLTIETIHESHGGEFPGNHARYILRTKVTIRDDERRAA